MAEAFSLKVCGYAATIPVRDDEVLLESLQKAGFQQRKACRNGVCQICDARLLSGAVFQRYPRAEYTAAREIKEILLCTSYPRSDIEVELIRYSPPGGSSV